ELQAAAQPRLVDVGQERVHLRLVGELLQERAERLLDLLQLLDVDVVVDRLRLLRGVLLLQLDLFLLRAVERVVLILPYERRTAGDDEEQNEQQQRETRQDRPVANLADIETADVVERHTSFAPLGLAGGAGAVAGGAGVAAAGAAGAGRAA